MEKLFLILFVGVINVNCLTPSKSDNSKALYLTKYIENGQFDLAKNLSFVKPKLMKGIPSYSGYLTVNKDYNSNIFFWFFPAEVNPSTAPIHLWLQGGPGSSGLYGLFLENGPFFISQNKLALRKYSWHKNYNMLYVDSPVGTGFSFTDNTTDYARNQKDVAVDLFSAVRQFFMIFSELRDNAFYISGESYGGKYIPALAYAILKHSTSKDINDRINLQGLTIGNGLTDPINQINYGELLYQLGLIDFNARQEFIETQNDVIYYIQQRKFKEAYNLYKTIIGSKKSLFNKLTGFTSPYNYLDSNSYQSSITNLAKFMKSPNFGKALHVGNKVFQSYGDSGLVFKYLYNDIMASYSDLVAQLLEHYRILIYTGQMDIIAGYTLVENYIRNMDFNCADEYSEAPRNIWRVDNEIAGYVKKAGNLTSIMVRNAGHMVPKDQPKWALDMMLKFTAGKEFS